MSNITAVVDEQIGRIHACIDQLEQAKILPFEYEGERFDASDLRQNLKEISESEFTIAVCGAVKAGKSMFLNALLFGDRVLPTDATPCTAKLTFISHTDGKPYFEAKFFTQADYDKMRQELKPQQLAELMAREEASARRGVFPQQLWGQVKRCDGRGMFGDLIDYIGQDGCFTPYVEEIRICIDCPELKGIQIVDTPGLDDPNPLNSKVTEDWAYSAHAAVYLTPWRGVNEKDMEFVRKHFGKMGKVGAQVSNRVFVLTKIDENSDWGETLEYFKSRFPEDKDSVCGYSSMIVLLRSLEQRKKKLSEDELCCLEDHEDLDPDPQDVKRVIASKLCADGTRTRQRIDKCRQIVEAMLSAYDDKLRRELEDLGIRQDMCSRTIKDVESQERDLNKLRQDFDRNCGRICTEGKNAIRNPPDYQDQINKSHEILKRKIETRMKSCGRDSSLIPTAVSCVDDANFELKKLADHLAGSVGSAVENALQEVKNAVRNQVVRAKCEDVISEPDTTWLVRAIAKLRQDISMTIDEHELEKKISFWSKTSTNANEVLVKVVECMRICYDGLEPKICDFISKSQGKLSGYVGDVKAEVEQRIDEIKTRLKLNPAEQRLELDKVKAQLEEVQGRIKDFDNMRITFKI